MKFIITLLIMSTLVYADDVINPTPSKLNSEANVALTEYHHNVDKLTDKLRADLQKAQDVATRKGDLDTALAIKAEIGKLGKGNGVDPIDNDALANKAQGPSKDVTFYVQTGFNGPGTIVKQFETILDVSNVGFPNDALRSIKVPVGYEVIVYQNEKGGGLMTTITKDTADLTNTQATGMSSFLIHRKR